MKKLIITFAFIISGFSGSLAQDFPIQIPAGSHPDPNFPLETDTWIITDAELDSCLVYKDRHDLLEQQVERLERDIEILETINVKSDSIRHILEEGYNHYADKWETTQENLTQEKLRVVKWKNLTWQIGLGTLAVGVIVGTQI